MNHPTVYREQDEYYCVRCGKRWSASDRNPPKCLSKREYGLMQIRQLRFKYFGY